MLASVIPSHVGRTLTWLLPVIALYSSALQAQETGIPFKSSGGDAASQFLDVLLLLGLLMGVAAVIVAVYRKRLVNDGSIPAERGVHLRSSIERSCRPDSLPTWLRWQEVNCLFVTPGRVSP